MNPVRGPGVKKSVLWIAALAALAAAAAGWAISLWTSAAPGVAGVAVPVAVAAEWGRACWRWTQESVASVGTAAGNLPPTVGLFLLASFVYGGIRGGMSYVRTRRFLRRLPVTDPGPPGAALDKRALGIGEDIRLRVVEDAGLFAFTGGFLAPRVYVSRGMAEAFSPEEIRSVLAHERAHVVRKDPLRGWVADTLAAALWFLPVAGYLRRRFLAAAEEEADDQAARGEEERWVLASALVKAARGQTRGVYVAAPGFGGEDPFSRRVERLVGDPAGSAGGGRRNRAWRPVLVRSAGVVTLLGVLSLGGFDFTGTQAARPWAFPEGPLGGPARMMRGMPDRGPMWGMGMGGGMRFRGRWSPQMRERMERMWNRGGMGPRFWTPGGPARGVSPRGRRESPAGRYADPSRRPGGPETPKLGTPGSMTPGSMTPGSRTLGR